MKHIKVKVKMTILTSFTLIGILIIAGVSIVNFKKQIINTADLVESSIRSEYDTNIKNQIENTLSLDNAIYEQYQLGEYTLDEAKKIAADLVRSLRYGENGYFWIDTYDGTNIVLLGGSTEGTNRIGAKDADGFEMVREIIRVGQEEAGGYTNYVFPKEGETVSSPKRSYSKSFEPFEWVIGDRKSVV